MTTKANSKTEKVAAQATEQFANASKKTFESMMKMSADATAESYKNTAAFGEEQIDAAKSGYDRAAGYGKDNLNSYSEASSAIIAGWEAYCEGVVDYAKVAATENIDLVERLCAVKTPQEAMDLQVEAANKAFNRVVTQSTKMNQIAADTMTKSFDPIKGRVNEMVDAFLKP